MSKRTQALVGILGIVGVVLGVAVFYAYLSGVFSNDETAEARRGREKLEVMALLRDWDRMPVADRRAALPEVAKTWQFGEDELRWQAAQAFGSMGPEAVPYLLEALKDPDELVRMYAVWSLGMLGPDARFAFDAAVKALKDDRPEVRAKAAFAVRRIAARPEDAVPPLVEVLGDDDEEVRQAASQALARFGPAAIPDLRQALKTQSIDARRQAIVTLGLIGPEAAPAVPDLLALLRDAAGGVQDETSEALAGIGAPAVAAMGQTLAQEQDPAIRKRIILALSRVGKPALPALTQALQDQDASVRLQAVTALGRVGPEAVPPLRQAYQDSEAEVRQEVVRVLGTMTADDAGVVPALVEALKDASDAVRGQAFASLRAVGPNAGSLLNDVAPVLEDKNVEVRLNAVRFLAEFGAPAVPRLAAALKDPDPTVRQLVVRILEEIPTPPKSLYPALLPLLKSENPAVRQSAVNIFWRCGPPAVPQLVDALKDDAPLVRQAAVWSLHQVNAEPDKVFPAFVQAQADEDPTVRIGAATALIRFGGKAVPNLQTALKDKEPRVRQYTALAIGDLKASPADALALLAVAQKDESAEVRIAAANALGRFGIAAVPQLLGSFRDPDPKVWLQAKDAILKMQANDKQLLPLMLKALKDDDTAVQQGAAYTLSRFGADGVKPLMQLLQSSDERVHWAAVDTLDTIGPLAQPSYELLAKTAISHPTEKIRKGALVAMLTIHLGFLTDSKQEFRKEPAKAVSTVVESLQSKYGRNRWEAVEILAALGPAARDAVPALKPLQQDPDPRVRESVAKALERIGK